MRSCRYIFSLVFFLLLLFTGKAFAQSDTAVAVVVPESDTAKIIHAKCFGYLDQNKWDSALTYAVILHELARNEAGELSDRNAISLYLIGEIYRVIANYPSAYKYFNQSTGIYSKIYPHILDWGMYGLTMSRLGFTCIQLGATDEAMRYFTKAMEINDKANNGDFIPMQIQFAVMSTSKGEYAKADSIYTALNRMLDTLPKSGFEHYLLASVYNNRAVLYSQIGNPQKALSFLKKAVPMEAIAKNEGYEGSEYEAALLNLVEAYTLNNQTDSALIKYREAEDSLPAKSGLLYANLLKEKAFIYQHQNKLSAAISLYLQYVKVIDSLTVKPADYQANLVNLAILYTDTKQFNKADSLLRLQVSSLRKSGLHYSYTMQQSVAALCANLIEMRRYKEATDSLIALCHLTFDAMVKNFAGMSESEKLQYEYDINKIFDLLYVSVYNNKTIPKKILAAVYQLELKRKGLIINSQVNLLNNARNSKDSVFLQAYNGWLSNRQMLAKQYSLSYSERFLDIDSLVEVNERLEKKVASKAFEIAPAGHTHFNHPGTVNSRSSFADIAFVRFDYKAGKTAADSAFYMAFIRTSADTVPALVHLCSEKALLRTMKDEKGRWINGNQLTQHLYSAKTESASSFYRFVWQPMEKYLGGIKTINYSTSGALNNIAFHALYYGEGYLGNRYDFRRYYSLADAGNNEGDFGQPGAASIWGNMDYNKAAYNQSPATTGIAPSSESFSIVPATIKSTATTKNMAKGPLPTLNTNEPSQLKKIFGAHHMRISSYEHAMATEEDFKRSSSSISGVLHISTHGFYTPLDKKKKKATLPGNFIAGIENPLFRCGLAFSGVNYYWLKGVVRHNHDDGILAGYEVAQLDLHNVQLVTLSACETGLGDITGNGASLGLQRAFKLAGAHKLLVSLWQVPAKQTAELLSLFYTNWLNGQSISKALQAAELSMEKKYPPYYWAGFVLIE